jgi:Cytochrome b5-like Heme/Steroid binding domain
MKNRIYENIVKNYVFYFSQSISIHWPSNMEKDLPNPKHVTIVKKYPSYRDHLVNGCWKWIEGKRKDDNADSFWRIQNRLYDLTKFVEKHPGGKYWLEITKVSL